jgi:hypothetical protein
VRQRHRALELACAAAVVIAVLNWARRRRARHRKGYVVAARKKTAKKKSTMRSASRRTSARRSSERRASGPRTSAMSSEMFNPSGWVSNLLQSQTGRKIMAEALVAAAAAAAGVLVASRTETGKKAGRAIADASRRGGAIAKEAAVSAASAAADVITATAGDAITVAAKQLLTGGAEEREPDMAENAARRRMASRAH